MEREAIVIAVDGTSGSGKSTNSKLVAERLGFTYVDTGAMYRTFAWWCLKESLDVENEREIESAINSWGPDLENLNGKVWLTVDGYFPEKEIRTSEVSGIVSKVAAHPAVRKWMKESQQSCISFGDLVMEGRDIGSNIFPDSPYKFYIDANIELREERRLADGVNEDLAARDKLDSQRKHNPLVIPEGAVLVNTSGQTPDQSSQFILNKIDDIKQSLVESKN